MQENESRVAQDVPPPEARQIWQTALRILRNQVDRSEYDYWLKNLVLRGIENGVAQIAAPSTSARQRLESQYQKIVQQALVGVLGQPLTVHFVTEQPIQSRLESELPTRMQAKVPVAAGGRSGPQVNNSLGNRNGQFGYQRNLVSKTTPAMRTGIISNGLDTRPVSYPETGYIRENNTNYDYTEGNLELDDSENNQNGSAQENQYDESGYEAPPAPRNSSNLNPKYIFDKFIVGNSNRVTYSAARSVADNPGNHYNPLFIYGGVGLGKTHLLHAIGHEAIRQRSNLTALYVSSEKFTNDLVEAIRFRTTENFRNRYRNTDILMIDDIQFIAGKESSQEEFFHTFNALHGENKQIIICSDRPPKAMLVLEDRLRSRFEGGFITDIQMPNYEMRLAILQAKAEYQPNPVPAEVLDYIAGKIESNIRELEGALIRVVGFALHSHEALTIDVAKQALEEIMQNTRRKIVTPERVIETVSQYFSIDIKELKGRSRSADIVLPRQIAMYIIREHTESSLVEVGQAFGGRDHTTVMHGYDKIQREIETNAQLRQQVNTITQILYSGEHN